MDPKQLKAIENYEKFLAKFTSDELLDRWKHIQDSDDEFVLEVYQPSQEYMLFSEAGKLRRNHINEIKRNQKFDFGNLSIDLQLAA